MAAAPGDHELRSAAKLLVWRGLGSSSVRLSSSQPLSHDSAMTMNGSLYVSMKAMAGEECYHGPGLLVVND